MLAIEVLTNEEERDRSKQGSNWKHNEFAPITGVWTLEVGLNQDQENVDVSHMVTIAYAADESTTNPFPSDESAP